VSSRGPQPGSPPVILGVVHLRPLPGSPRYGGDRSAILAAAEADAAALLEGGCDGFVVENFGDAPFHATRVEPGVIAEMAVIASHLRRQAGPEPRLGINVLRNDAGAALAIAAAADADFIRVNVHTQGAWTDQGWVEGEAARTLRSRRALAAEGVRIYADVGVKHAIHRPGHDLGESARETVGRGLADGLIVSGAGTGRPTDPSDVATVRQAVPGVPILIGSGATAATIRALLECADGVIVGSCLKRDGLLEAPIDKERVEAFVEAARR